MDEFEANFKLFAFAYLLLVVVIYGRKSFIKCGLGHSAIKKLRPKFTNFCNKLVCLSLASLSQPSLMFVGKTTAYLNEAPHRYSTLKEAPSITHKH
jgi:hypothetical protein